MRAFLLVPVLAFAACAKEEPVAKPTGVVAKEGGITDETEVPADPDSRKFADHLVRHPLKNFVPSDGTSGAGIKWRTLTFGPKNHWEADAVLSADGETINCVEAGRWTMATAEAPNKGVLALETKKTDCPGRSDSAAYRLQLTWEQEDYTVVFR